MTRAVEVVLDPKWGRNLALQNAVYVLAGWAAVVSVLQGHISLLLGGGLVVAVTCLGIGVDTWRFSHYQCARCQRRLPAPARWWEGSQEPHRIEFTCEHCQVVWVTRLSREA